MKSTTGSVECPRTSSPPPVTTTAPPPPPPPPPPTGCTTVSGEACVFPFNFGGETYNACTLDGNAPGETEPWCSTQTDSNDDHIGGQGYWGFCSSNCGTATTTTTTPPPCQNTRPDRQCQRRCNTDRRCSRRRYCRRFCDLTCDRCD